MYAKIALQVAITAILFFGFGITSVQGGKAETNTFTFQSDFDVITLSLCDQSDEVSLGGTAHFTFHETISADGSVKQSTHMNYMKTKGVGASGDKYEINESNHFTFQDKEETDIFHSVIKGKLIHAGRGTDTGIVINLLTTLDGDGEPKTEVDHVELKCSGPDS